MAKKIKQLKYVDLEPVMQKLYTFLESASDESILALANPDFYEALKTIPTEHKDLTEALFLSIHLKEDNSLEESIQPLSYSQRKRRAQIMKRYASKLKAARARLKNRRASAEKLSSRSRKKAIAFLRAKILKDRKYADLTPPEKIVLDKRLARIPDSVITRIARRLLPKVRQAETERLAHLHLGEAVELLDQLFVEEFGDSPYERLQGTDSLVQVYKNATPGQEDALLEFQLEVPNPEDTLGYSRHQMPQISDNEDFLKNLRRKGIKTEYSQVQPDTLKATQKHFNKEKIQSIMDKLGDGDEFSPILTSNDGYVLDGHHRWLAHSNADKPIDVCKINLPAEEAIQHMKDYPKSFTKKLAESLLKQLRENQSWT